MNSDQFVSSFIQSDFENLRGRTFHDLPGQPVTLLHWGSALHSVLKEQLEAREIIS